MKLTKYLYHVLTIKDVLNGEIYTLAYFHKNSVTSCRAVLNLLLFLREDFAGTKRTQDAKGTKSSKRHHKHQKAQKAQKHNQAKSQNANKRTKFKNVLYKHLSGKK